jgi:PAS domain S-box-containing protein
MKNAENSSIQTHKQAERIFTDTIIQSTPGLFYIFEKNSARFVRRNDNWSNITGYSDEELDTMTALDFFEKGPDRDMCAERMQDVYEHGFSSMENRLLTRSGNQIPYYFTGQRLVLDGTTYLVGLGLDISKRKQAEDELQKSEFFLRETQRVARLGGWKLNPETDFLAWTEGVYEIIEAPPDYKPGVKEGLKYYVPEYLPALQANIQRCFTAGEPFAQECELITESGKRIWAEVRGVARVVEGKTAYVYGTFQDISDRKGAEEEREKLLKILSAKNAELLSIVNIVSHDLRTPLVNIAGFGKELSDDCRQLQKLLQDATFSTDKAKKANTIINEYLPESLQFINASTSKMHMLLDGMIQVSRIGSTAINIEPLNMSMMLDKVIKTVQFKANEQGATITADELPGCLGDDAMINQVFSNLVGNALKYLDADRKGKIHISGRTEGQMSVYCVEDNGMGIAPEHHDKIFEVFHRLNPDDSGGEGLGLSIVMRILDRNDGEIRVESEPGKGSRFFISLPAAKA